jgi:Recombination endonuclease VII
MSQSTRTPQDVLLANGYEKKTECKSGHPFTPENTYVRRNGTRQCRACRNAASLACYYKSGKKSDRRMRNLKFNFSMTCEEFEALVTKQKGKCANPECGAIDAPQERLHVDHDHSCCAGRKTCGKCIRGLLCRRCNTILGMAEDRPELLTGLVRYLNDRHSSEFVCGK